MAHGTNYIQTINVGGVNYEIHDAQAIHEIADLNLANVLYFKGVKATKADLPTTGNLAGHVWHVTADDIEYVWVEGDDSSTSGTTETGYWEALGGITNAVPGDVYMNHKHPINGISVTGSGSVSNTVGTVSTSKVSATATAPTITVTPTTDEVLGSGTKFSGTAITSVGTTKLSATIADSTPVAAVTSVSAAAPTITVGPLTATAVVTNVPTKDITATASGTAVGANGTAKPITALGTPTTAAAITGFGTHTTAAAITELNTVTPTAVSIPNVTGNTSVTASKVSSAGSKTNGTACTMSVSNHILTLAPNTPTAVTLPTFTDVTATNTTLGTALTASKLGSAGTTAVATSAKSTAAAITALGTPTTADTITGFGTHTTATVLTGVKVTAQPTITVNGKGVASVITDTLIASATAPEITVETANALGTDATVTLKSGSSGNVTVATGGTSGTVTVTADSTDRVTAMTGASASATAPTVTVKSGTSGDVTVVTGVSKTNTTVSISGSASGVTNTPSI